MGKSYIADSIMREYDRKKRYEAKIQRKELEKFMKENCLKCKKRNIKKEILKKKYKKEIELKEFNFKCYNWIFQFKVSNNFRSYFTKESSYFTTFRLATDISHSTWNKSSVV